MAEAIAAVLQQLQASQQQFAQALAVQQEQLQRHQQEALRREEQNAQRTEALAQAMSALAAAGQGRSSRESGVVDVRQVGKPDNLKGSRETLQREWSTWSYTFATWFCSQFSKGEDALEWAKSQTQALTSAEVEAKSLEDGWKDLGRIDAQLHVALVSLCRDEALTVVKNSGRHAGLNAWRRLNAEYEPNNPQANLRLLKRILQPAGCAIPPRGPPCRHRVLGTWVPGLPHPRG